MSEATDKQLQFAKEIADTLQIKMVPKERQTKEVLRKYISEHITAYQERKKEILISRIKEELSILDYVVAAGLTPIPVGGQGLYTTKEHDSLRIDPRRNRYFYNSKGDTDSIIGFVAKYIYDGDYHKALTTLSSQLIDQAPILYEKKELQSNQGQEKKKQHKQLQLPEKGRDCRRVYAYLTSTRGIDPGIVNDFIKDNLLYQDTYGNCVFVSYDDNKKPIFANLRGTNPRKRYLMDVVGCDYQQGFYIDYQSDSMIVTESVIDAMSIMSILKAKEINYKKYNYMPLSGSRKTEAMYNKIKDKEIKNILLALDSDAAGRDSSIKVVEELKKKGLSVTEHIPHKKDWNEELVSCCKDKQLISKINFYQIHSSMIEKNRQKKRELERE